MDQETKQEFKNVTQKIDGLHNELTQKIDSLTNIVKESFDSLEDKMNRGFEENAREHRIFHQKLEDIELRLGNVAYAFEMQELDKRLIRVEKKLGLEV